MSSDPPMGLGYRLMLMLELLRWRPQIVPRSVMDTQHALMGNCFAATVLRVQDLPPTIHDIEIEGKLDLYQNHPAYFLKVCQPGGFLLFETVCVLCPQGHFHTFADVDGSMEECS